MKEPDPVRQAEFRDAIARFLSERRDAKLDKLADDDPKRAELIAQFEPAAWIEDAARRVTQIQAVTHTLKPIHPDARGTNLYRRPSELPSHTLVGSHALTGSFDADVVGNAAALDVYKFLRIEVAGRSLLDWLLADEPALKAVLHLDPGTAERLATAFKGLVQSRDDGASSHTLAKQMYWLMNDGEPTRDEHYRLLAPLYASSLAHAVFKSVNESRFGETTKAARQARRDNKPHPQGYADYPGLAVQKLGGTKPRNISQLNSERGGNNYLLASLPPVWTSLEDPRPRPGRTSMFDGWEKEVGMWLKSGELRDFLAGAPAKNMETRDQRDALSEGLVDLVLMLANALQSLPPGWSAKPGCALNRDEQLWLDPRRYETDPMFRAEWISGAWQIRICDRFGAWVNGRLKDKLPKVGDVEHRHWSRELEKSQDWQYELDQMRRQYEAFDKQQSEVPV